MKRLLPAILLPFLAATPGRAFTVRTVVWSGMPTGNAGNKEWFAGFSNAALNDAGTIAFDASVITISTNGPSRVSNSWTGIWTITSSGAKSLVAGTPHTYPPLAGAPGFGSLGAPVLNNSNLCAFVGSYHFDWPPVIASGSPVTNFATAGGGTGVWVGQVYGTPLAFLGESAPGYTNPFTTSIGTLDWLDSLSASNAITFTNWPAFSSIDRIALPDTGGLVFSATVTATNLYYPPPSTNPGSPVPLFVAIEPLTQHGVWSQASNGQILPLVLEGETLLEGSSTLTIGSISFDPSTNSPSGAAPGNPLLFGPRNVNPSNGNVALGASFTDGSYGLLIAQSGSDSLTFVAHTGDPVPGGGSNDQFLSFGNPDQNSQGHVAFAATAATITTAPILYDAMTPPTTNLPATNAATNGLYTNTWSGIWAEDTNGVLGLVARSGPPIPDIGGFISFDAILFNERHQVAFRARSRPGFITYPSGSFAGGAGIWLAPDTTNPIAWIGEAAPGYPTNFTLSTPSPYPWSTNAISFRSAAPVFSSFYHSALPDTGGLILWATVSVTNTIPRPTIPRGVKPNSTNPVSRVFSQNGIWIRDSSGLLRLALREGMNIPVNGKTRTIASIPFTPMINDPAAGQTRLFSRATGEVVTPVTFTDGTQAIVTIAP